MRGPSITGFAVAILAMLLSATLNAQEAKVPSKPLAHIGFLSCHVASGWGLVFGTQTPMHLHANRQNQGIRAVHGFNQQIWN
jgi:hypothetical protein